LGRVLRQLSQQGGDGGRGGATQVSVILVFGIGLAFFPLCLVIEGNAGGHAKHLSGSPSTFEHPFAPLIPAAAKYLRSDLFSLYYPEKENNRMLQFEAYCYRGMLVM
jgi:hypothetical protein